MTAPEPDPAAPSADDRTADERLEALLAEIERDPARAMKALRERFPEHADDELDP